MANKSKDIGTKAETAVVRAARTRGFPGITRLSGRNKAAPQSATNTRRGLTHSSDATREGLAMKATRKSAHPRRPGTHPNRGLRGPLADRLWARVDRRGPDECWPWTGPLDGDRGRLGKGGKYGGLIRSHQAAWVVTHGPIPPGQVVRHKCDNAVCCNPEHLELGTIADNNRDMVERHRLNTSGMTFGSDPKTTPEQAERIRALLAEGRSQREVAALFGISQSSVSRIHRREVHA